MISLITCARKSDIPQILRNNVSLSIGSTPYEWIVIDNSKNDHSIFQAYNEGVQRSKGDILCFLHDDVLFHSEKWGNKVVEYFEKYPKLGCIGVAGCHLLLNTPSSFWHSGTSCMHYYGRDKYGNMELVGLPDEKSGEGLKKVASVDGIWMCIRRCLFDTIRFDDISFNGFHCYDSDICMQILKAGYDIGIAFGIAVEHSKRGFQDASYFNNIRIWHSKWTDYLPIAIGASYSDNDITIRTSMVKQIVELEEQVLLAKKVYDSKAYRLGKAILTPFNILKNKWKN